MSALRPLLRLIGPHRPLLVVAVVCGVAHQLAILASAGTAAWLVGAAVTGTPAADLRGRLILLGVLVLPLGITPWLESLLAHMAAFRVLVDVRGRVHAAFERLSPGHLLLHRSGDLGATAISDVELLELFFAHTLSPLIVAATVPVATVVVLAVVHPLLALVLLPILVLLASVPGWLRRRSEAQGAEQRARFGALSAEAVDTVQGMRELVSFGAGASQRDRLRAADDRLRASRIAHGVRAGGESATTDALSVAGLLAVLVTAGALVSADRLPVELLPVAVVLAAVTFAPVLAVTEVARDLGLVGAAAARIERLLAAPAPVVDLTDIAPPGPYPSSVRFDGVSFRYGAELPDAVSDVSFTVSPGETVALVGESGAGKSTCAGLLLRLWDVGSGRIEVGGHDVRDYPQEDLRSLVTLVPQDAYLFATSIRENIRLARPAATDDEVRAAAAAAQLDEFVAGLPDGYDTVTGERGVQLSGGQRQRVALARALLAEAPILVLDEAVSNVDAIGERDVAAALDAARPGGTTLVIAHRLSTIRRADRIVVLEHGRVTATGTHASLSAQDGPYRRLLASQLDPVTP